MVGGNPSENPSSDSPRGQARGRALEPEPIDVLLRKWLRANRVRKRVLREDIFRAWEGVVGAEIAEHTRVLRYERGVLEVEVDSAALLHELSTYYQQEILSSLRGTEELASVRDLRFRAGSF